MTDMSVMNVVQLPVQESTHITINRGCSSSQPIPFAALKMRQLWIRVLQIGNGSQEEKVDAHWKDIQSHKHHKSETREQEWTCNQKQGPRYNSRRSQVNLPDVRLFHIIKNGAIRIEVIGRVLSHVTCSIRKNVHWPSSCQHDKDHVPHIEMRVFFLCFL